NHCNLTVNIFGDNARFITGNKCERGAGSAQVAEILPNMFEYKRRKLAQLEQSCTLTQGRAIVGIPMALGMYELAPMWKRIFSKLGFNVVMSKLSSRKTYTKGQHTIPSDTVCYPAKLVHGHVEELLDKGADLVFYPCLTYNFDEQKGDNCYNCPVVAYYSELLDANIRALKNKLLMPYLNINNPAELAKGLRRALAHKGYSFSSAKVREAVQSGLECYRQHMADIAAEGSRCIQYARENGKRILILAGIPYHADPEICHLIDKLATGLGFVVVSEDGVADKTEHAKVDVLNQWTYHSRLYNAAKFAVENDDCNLVQLVSFGCGIDAITSDEVRSILEQGDKVYPQLKIDEINNLGAVKIRLRSLVAALEEREAKNE
ncbi:MAG: 2-hydroxyacyl-CoA dehydratase, partial [Clostridia bacterium]|nr:2-hydroxyacyl-CoA dehydratase [Clostridia bacterium]